MKILKAKKMSAKDIAQKLTKLFSELEGCNEEEQKAKIEEMNEVIERMSKEDFNSIFSGCLLDNLNKMIEEEKLTLENACLLGKHIGYFKVLKCEWIPDFDYCSLNERFQKMIIDEDEKEEGKDEKLLVDLCECYLMLVHEIHWRLISICVPYLLKVALNKVEDENAQKEVEMALLALSRIGEYGWIGEQHQKEIKEILKHHQKHRNLTCLAYYSAWRLLINGLYGNRKLEQMIVNKLHFAREAGRELNEEAKCVNWAVKNKKQETEEDILLMKWLKILHVFIKDCKLWNEEYSELIGSIVQIFRVAMANHRGISCRCMELLRGAAGKRNIEIDDLLKGGVFDLILKELQRPTLNDSFFMNYMICLLEILKRLKKEEDGEASEAKRKAMKMEIHEMMEEEGYKDTNTSFHGIFYFIDKTKYYSYQLSMHISDYSLNV
ncbi:uncharacterized protein MONOS_4190 [Monocercomonoides exilis]|uniref:uncharacterized protein n=1 Tax=Monocercomonoides exilis TaxID=2049356 RepID=UPI00355A8B25|nr:hypothetical protein MONOS_4190 [Monocercomonoides exilis]